VSDTCRYWWYNTWRYWWLWVIPAGTDDTIPEGTGDCEWYLQVLMIQYLKVLVIVSDTCRYTCKCWWLLVICAGNDGKAITLQTNVFPVQMSHQYCLFQYHVDFNPAVLSTAMRKSMMAEKRDMFGSFYMFNGTQLFLQLKLDSEVSFWWQPISSLTF